MSKRPRHERMIKRFDPLHARQAFEDIARSKGRFGFLDFLDDATVETIARDLLTEHRRAMTFNQRERARAAARRQMALTDGSR